MSARRILLVSATTGYELRAYREAAAKLGVELTLASNRCHQLQDPWGDDAVPVRFEEPKAAIEEIRKRGPYRGVAACGDRAAVVAGFLAERLGLRFHPFHAGETCHDKFEFRQVLEHAGLPLPQFRREKLNADPAGMARQVQYPCVLKPPTLSASRGVIRANDPVEFKSAFDRIRKLLQSGELQNQNQGQAGANWILAEDYIDGREYALEGWMSAGVLHRFAMFDKPDPLHGPFFEETLYVTPSRLELDRRAMIWDMVEAAARAARLGPGPIHAEIRLHTDARGDTAYVLEIAPRAIGGLCGRALRFERTPDAGAASGERIGLEELLLRGALGEPVGVWQRETAASGVMMIPIPGSGVLDQVEGVEAARALQLPDARIEGIEITARPGEPLQALPEGSSYLGFIFARGDSPAAVEDALRAAHAQLHVRMHELLPVV